MEEPVLNKLVCMYADRSMYMMTIVIEMYSTQCTGHSGISGSNVLDIEWC